jgi:NhaP-type Na+/H+ or K+/H+ antiporter
MGLAFLGTLISCAIIAVSILVFAEIYGLNNLLISEAIALSALLSSTDPVCILATLKSLSNITPTIYYLVLGEVKF